jgi:hypothetical protein
MFSRFVPSADAGPEGSAEGAGGAEAGGAEAGGPEAGSDADGASDGDVPASADGVKLDGVATPDGCGDGASAPHPAATTAMRTATTSAA